ncbi:hypothetical protein PGB28_17150 [Primorskyibacter aestuariivivens]|uniref:hypothetical protein n=1 Tax=Primorskyibacter aestuariivivens TaxID=1888912 RepID=UPI002301C4C2|nr:hypothetical protein [Primorskyibacter aestuariivivens]MDA7430193.1 hypothetical protein [Primorskyibacter aestuariivivens]
MSKDHEIYTHENAARLANHMRSIREGTNLWLNRSSDAGWEVLAGPGEWIILDCEQELANELLAALCLQYRRFTAILGNPDAQVNRDRVAQSDEFNWA